VDLNPNAALLLAYSTTLITYALLFVIWMIKGGFSRRRCAVMAVLANLHLVLGFVLDLPVGIGFGAGSASAWALFLLFGTDNRMAAP
jgi:hypothetical protein